MTTLLWVASFKIKKILRAKIYRRSILIKVSWLKRFHLPLFQRALARVGILAGPHYCPDIDIYFWVLSEDSDMACPPVDAGS